MNETTATVPYTVLHARGFGARSDELLNAGIVLHTPDGPRVAIAQDAARLRALHPDYSAVDLTGWAQALEWTLQQHFMTLHEPQQQHALLTLFARPFTPAQDMGTATLAADSANTLQELMAWLVNAPARTLSATRREVSKRPTKLASELRAWLRGAKAFSTKADDLKHGKVVANYPIDPGADLYADFAVLNGKLNAIETLDLRGVERLTPGLRGDAAIKGITLDEARAKIDGKRVVVLSASDYSVARPAIQLISRYADEVWDMHHADERQHLADFIAGALHRNQLPGLQLAS
jgi:hypothetical protein